MYGRIISRLCSIPFLLLSCASFQNQIPSSIPAPNLSIIFDKAIGDTGYDRLDRPVDVVAMNDGALIVADEGAGRLVFFDKAGDIYRAAGQFKPGSGIKTPSGLARWSDWVIYMSDKDASTVIRHDLRRGDFEDLEQSLEKQEGKRIGWSEPAGLCFDDSGRMLVADKGNDRVVVVSPAGSPEMNIIDAGGVFLRAPSDVSARLGKIYIADTGNDRIVVLDDRDASLIAVITNIPGKGHLTAPEGVEAVELTGATVLFISDTGNSRVLAVDEAGRLLTETTGIIIQPAGLAVVPVPGGEGWFLYVADPAKKAVLRFQLRRTE